MSQYALDDAYANGAYIPGAESFPPRWAQEAENFCQSMLKEDRATLDMRYGEGDREKLDLFLPEEEPAGLCVFVHGGYWRAFDKTSWSHLAAGPLSHGWAVAMPSYDLCPDVRISDITLQILRAVTEAAAHVDGPILLAGHSAGGHLVARTACQNVLPTNVARRLTHVMPISPLSDLRPLMQTSMNEDFALDDAAAVAESPILKSPLNVPITVWVGADERPAFLDQAQWLAEAWECGHVVEEGRHHFDVIEGLADPNSLITQMLVTGARA
ncbi:alpha/beta hydrolase [uncultured Shimia sp.]|uniref:alpha/beta hydrolase n=1 Tax=uncultured Shimia sp. TaxID=573152 RepID=UPI00261C7BB2|nr:alpha/beta hydrolase [uncultured Shimia sp.]